MTRQLAKYALWALVLAALFSVGLQRKRKSSAAAQSHKEALITWEDEGGALLS